MSSTAWHFRLLTLVLLVPFVVWGAVTSSVVRVDQDVRHPETQQLLRISDARAVINIHPNAKDASLVDVEVNLDALATTPEARQTYRLVGITKGTFKKAATFPHTMPITCALHFFSAKQTSGGGVLVLNGDVVEFAHGAPALYLRQAIATQK